MRAARSVLCAALISLLLGGCTDVASLSGYRAPGAALTVHIVDSPELVGAFQPVLGRVQPGAAVVFVNASGDFHTVTFYSAPQAGSSGGIRPGGSFRTTLGAPGHYLYRCAFHQGMTGEIDVTTSRTAPPSPSASSSAARGGG